MIAKNPEQVEKELKKQKGSIDNYFHNSNFDISDNDTVLEIGCGPGNNILEFRRAFKNIKYDGFDIEQDAVSFVNEYISDKNSNVWVADIRDLNTLEKIPDDKYDWIIMLAVIEWVTVDTVEKTDTLHKQIINTLFNKCKKGFFLTAAIDKTDMQRIKLSWNPRYSADYIKIFKDLPGQFYLLPEADNCIGFLAKKNEKNRTDVECAV